jgi:uncharacterized coiled-coil protein SlyX
MDDEKTIEQLIELVAQQQRVISSANKYIADVNEVVLLQQEYIDAIEEQVKYYQSLKLSLWN